MIRIKLNQLLNDELYVLGTIVLHEYLQFMIYVQIHGSITWVSKRSWTLIRAFCFQLRLMSTHVYFAAPKLSNQFFAGIMRLRSLMQFLNFMSFYYFITVYYLYFSRCLDVPEQNMYLGFKNLHEVPNLIIKHHYVI